MCAPRKRQSAPFVLRSISSFEWENHGKDELGFEGLLFTHRQNDLSMQGKTKTLIVIGRIIVNMT